LAFVTWTLFATGVLSLYTARGGEAWIFVAHGVLGFALAALLVWKLRRVWRRVGFGLVALIVVALALVSGWVWSSGGELIVGGYNLLAWHMIVSTLLVVVVLGHAAQRRKPLRARDVRVGGRRQFLALGGVAVGAFAVWQLQRPFNTVLGLRGARRRFSGSYERGSFAGNEGFPPTSWVADRPRALDSPDYRVRVDGLVDAPFELSPGDIGTGDTVEALLDCTSGWYTRQRWSGTRVDRLVARAGAHEGAGHLRVVSHTGYRWSFPLSEASRLLLATHVGDEPLTHGHGAPARLVAPGRRGFQWVKWVVRIELIEDVDLGAPASTVWSSGTPEGRGEA
jgi:DMSO/TMAO reductase YedYZ molybdopterin-dependent catalytic subunit